MNLLVKDLRGLPKNRLHPCRIQLLKPTLRIKPIRLLLDIRPSNNIQLASIYLYVYVGIDIQNSQLCPNKSAAKPTPRNALDHPLYPLQQVLRISGSGVAPIARLLPAIGILVAQRNVDPAKLGANDGRGRVVASAGIDACDFVDKHVAPGFGAENGVEARACLFQLGGVAVVVEGGEVGADVLPAAVVVDAPRGIQSPRI